jgi:hypothetical protein
MIDERVKSIRSYSDPKNWPRPELPTKRVTKNKQVFQDGMLVAANVAKDSDGRALFGKVDPDFRDGGWIKRLCQLCGNRIALSDWLVFPGEFDAWGYKEVPLHVECARYSILVCPHIRKKQAFMGVSVCKKFGYRLCTPPLFEDDWAVPSWDGLRDWEKLGLSFAHDIQYKDDGSAFCATCPEQSNNKNMGIMTIPEFIFWSAA